jgi:hypothetical protein
MHKLTNPLPQALLGPPDYLQRQCIDHDAPPADPVILDCFACGRPYHRGVGRFCCQQCCAAFNAGVSAHERAVVRYSLPTAGDGFVVICAVCGEPFSSRGLRYCSTECRKQAPSGPGPEPPAQRVCPCGNAIPRFRGDGKARRAVRADARFCSDRCRQKFAEQESASAEVLTAIEVKRPPVLLGFQRPFERPSTLDLSPGESGRRVGSLRVWGPGLSEIEIRCATPTTGGQR